MTTGKFLIEIGTEEMPAERLDVLIGAFEAHLNGAADVARISDAPIRCLGTPRRLVGYTASLSLHQPDRTRMKLGPPVKVGRTAHGEWTRAALGFARRLGLEGSAAEEALTTWPKGDRDYVAIKETIPGRPTIEVLPGIIERALRDTAAMGPMMNWDAKIGGRPFPFTRPIRWIVALFDRQVVPFSIEVVGGEPVVSGDRSRGHRFRSRIGNPGEQFEVDSFASLEEGLRKRHVIVDPEKRKKKLGMALGAAAEGLGPLVALKEQHHHHLVEWPGAVLGRYSEEFQQLPKEIRYAVLIHHQKFLPLEGDCAFLAVVNMPNDPTRAIRRGVERVVRARLRDAQFFWNEALSKPLADRRTDLNKVAFHQRIGSLRDHSRRIARLSRWIAERVGANPDIAERAAAVAKCDLTTSLVGEFPSLQGEAGGLILEAHGVSPALWIAVYHQYRPVGLHSDLPETVDGAVLALADRAASLAGLFVAGEVPSGSGDPFGLRRMALGMLSILREADGEYPDHAGGWPTPAELLRQSLADPDYEPLEADSQEVWTRLIAFVADRLPHALTLRNMLAGVPRAVLAVRGVEHPVADSWQRILALRDAVKAGDYATLAVAHKRARRILTPEAHGTKPTRNLLSEDAELELFGALYSVELSVGKLSAAGRYSEAFSLIAGLAPKVDAFFDKVLVMAEDPEVRANRLALLARLDALFSEVGDLSQIESAAP